MDLTTMCSKFFDNDKNKQQLKVLLKPMVNMILHELKPYIYALVIFINDVNFHITNKIIHFKI